MLTMLLARKVGYIRHEIIVVIVDDVSTVLVVIVVCSQLSHSHAIMLRRRAIIQ